MCFIVVLAFIVGGPGLALVVFIASLFVGGDDTYDGGRKSR